MELKHLQLKFLIHSRQPGFTYSACGPLTKSKKEYKNLKKQEIQDEDPKFKIQEEACFQQNMADRI